MKTSSLETNPADIDSLITSVRGQKVILDAELAGIYGVPTKALNQAVKRNRDKFPEDFLFRLTPREAQEARPPVRPSAVPEVTPHRSQIVTGSQKHRDPRYLPPGEIALMWQTSPPRMPRLKGMEIDSPSSVKQAGRV